MVEHQLPKLTVRVRFPSSAPIQKARSEAVSEAWPFVVSRAEQTVVPLGGHERPGRTAVVLVVLALLVVDVRVDRVGDGLVRAPRLVLVDHGGPLGVVAHPGHEVAQSGPAVGGELVAVVP